jgi:excisionase family DNA binding protein
MPDTIPIAQAAREFNLHRATLYRYVRSGRLTAYERGVGRGVYVDRDELRALHEVRPVADQAEGDR